MLDKSFWKDRSVLVTGHTGFKGGWLSAWLISMGAKVTGYSLAPNTFMSFYNSCNLEDKFADSCFKDINDKDDLFKCFDDNRPSVVFHLAAQPLVGQSYIAPVYTFNTNVMGTINVLEAIRHFPSVKSAVIITTDKCYENLEQNTGYKETDKLGGYDPYGASKACAEIAVAAYRRAFFDKKYVATARAGNVIGGGDWAADRIVVNAIQALMENQSLQLRYPNAIRPWQHVLDVTHGYLLLAEKLTKLGNAYEGAWNFGPTDADVTVQQLVNHISLEWGKVIKVNLAPNPPLETTILKLDSEKALWDLGWKTELDINDIIQFTVKWYKAFYDNHDMYNLTIDQIDYYRKMYLYDNN